MLTQSSVLVKNECWMESKNSIRSSCLAQQKNTPAAVSPVQALKGSISADDEPLHFFFFPPFCVPAHLKHQIDSVGTVCRSLSSDVSFIAKFSLVIKGNGAEKVRDLEQGVSPPGLRVIQKADAFGFPSRSSLRLYAEAPSVLRDGHTGSRRRQGKDVRCLDWRCFCSVR